MNHIESVIFCLWSLKVSEQPLLSLSFCLQPKTFSKPKVRWSDHASHSSCLLCFWADGQANLARTRFLGAMAMCWDLIEGSSGKISDENHRYASGLGFAPRCFKKQVRKALTFSWSWDFVNTGYFPRYYWSIVLLHWRSSNIFLAND